MLYLIGSIILTSWLTLSFKIIERLRINTFQAIVFNYITCVITGSILNGKFPLQQTILREDWFRWALLMGATFISLFNLVALTTQKIGVSVATVANKLSLVVPFMFSIYFYQENINAGKAAGILLALVAVVLTCMRKTESPDDMKSHWLTSAVFILPFFLFLGSGLLDTMIKYVEQTFLHENNYNSYLVSAFASAATVGITILILLLLTGRQKFSFRAVLAGMAVGIPNYFSIWCLIKVLKANPGKSSAIIPVNNMGIVLFSAVVAWLAFHEKLTIVNWTGIILSMLSIALIAYS
jgi:drug/metabolite transporter (DMT)-like permease